MPNTPIVKAPESSRPKLTLVQAPRFSEGECVEVRVDDVWLSAVVQAVWMKGDWIVVALDNGTVIGEPKSYIRYPFND